MTQPVRVLLVDDDPSYHTLTSRMLAHSEQHFVVDWAGSYSEGLAAMQQSTYDIFLIDYNLGSINGIELMQQALDNGIDTPVIMMTGHGKRGLDVEALQAGATDYIDKVELRPASLQRSIRYALERDRILKQQQASEELYRTLIENAFDGILIIDRSGQIMLGNNRAGQMLAADPGALKGKNLMEYLLTVSGAAAATRSHNILETTESVVLERALRKLDGSQITVEMGISPVDEDRLQIVMRDISNREDTLLERDRYIEQLTILRQVDEEISQTLNINFVLTIALDAAVRLSGADAGFVALVEHVKPDEHADNPTEDDAPAQRRIRLEQAIGRYANYIGTDNLPAMPLVERLMAEPEPEPRLILDVSQEPAFVSVEPDTRAQMLLPMQSYDSMVGILNLETSKPERFTEALFDFLKLIGSRAAIAVENAQLYKVAQDRYNELQQLYTQVSELETLKTDMIRIAAHDIRNPVSVVLGYTELMEAMIERNNVAKLRSYITMIERAARRMEKITTDILSLERIEKMRDEDTDATLDISTMVRETFEEFEGQAGLKSQTMTLDVPPRPITVRGDIAQMREATANLISNAIKYTQPGGQITISLSIEADDVVFRVVDNGFGIPEDQQKSLFQPFFRASSEETAQIEGTGLGLYLIKNIVERYDGHIVFSSVYGEGSTFGFRMPLVS